MRWKTAQKHRKIRRKTKLGLLVLGVLIGLLLFSQLTNFVKVLARPYNSISAQKNYTWDGEFNLNFVMNTKPLSLVSYNPQDKKVTILTIPDTTLIDLPGGFGKWQARAIYELGGENLVKSSISQFFGIPIDGYSSENLVDHFRGNPFSGIEVLSRLHSDLTGFELIRLKMSLLQVRFDKINRIDLLKLIVLDKEKLADGTEVFTADPIRLDSVMGNFAESKIQSEHLSIAVFNATDKPLLAQMAKRLITNIGGNVIVTQNAPLKISKTYVEGEKSKTLDRLTQIFDLGCQSRTRIGAGPKCDKIPRADLGLGSLRAQIIVVLGEDFP